MKRRQKKSKPVLDHPGDDAHPSKVALWYASGPGRACKWQQWARTIKQDDPRYPVAQNVLEQVEEIRRLYSQGANDLANIYVERLEINRPAAALFGHAEDIGRGQKSVQSGKKGHETVHGTPEVKQARWASYQEFIDKKKQENASLSYTHRCELAAKHFGVCLKTITTHTKK